MFFFVTEHIDELMKATEDHLVNGTYPEPMSEQPATLYSTGPQVDMEILIEQATTSSRGLAKK